MVQGAHKKSLFSMVPTLGHKKDRTLYDEDEFNRLLCLERKRVERSGMALLLMLFDLRQVSESRRHAWLEKIAELVPHRLREIDLCGWLKQMDTLAIIFTEIPKSEAVQALEAVEQKVRVFLKEELDSAVCQGLKLSTILFPDERKGGEDEESFKRLLYPDLEQVEPVMRVAEALKRVMDLVVAIVVLLVLSPLLALVALLIKATSPGPIFFRQTRLGLHGKEFTFYKFRSMQVDSDDGIHRQFMKDFIANKEDDGKTIFKIQNDPRLTTIGGMLRKSSIDEIPQLLNVLAGDMSLVGPRPPIPYEVDNYDIWHRYRILGKKPGITGLWQVKGRSQTTFDAMVRLDLQYIQKWSLWLDIKLLLATPLAVIRGKGGY